MPCFMGHYQNAATDRPRKLKRAIQSFIDQPYPQKELIIIADGCQETLSVYQDFKANSGFPEDLIKFLYLPKQEQFSGILRNVGIGNASGDIISYLDSDDRLFGDHLGSIARNFGSADWVYFNDYTAKDTALNMRERETLISFGRIGTSSIAHRRNLKDIIWVDGYGHDWDLILQLSIKYANNKKIVAAGYQVCHLPAGIDY